jgi:hypothetical protein
MAAQSSAERPRDQAWMETDRVVSALNFLCVRSCYCFDPMSLRGVPTVPLWRSLEADQATEGGRKEGKAGE